MPRQFFTIASRSLGRDSGSCRKQVKRLAERHLELAICPGRVREYDIQHPCVSHAAAELRTTAPAWFARKIDCCECGATHCDSINEPALYSKEPTTPRV